MIPANAFTPTPIISNFQPPYDQPYQPLLQNVLGGVAIGNASLGRQVKIWTVAYNGVSITVKPIDGPIAFTLVAANVQTVSLAFDNNMGLVIAWQVIGGGSNLYYFDTLTSQYITRLFAGTTSCRVCVDDARDFYTSQSDVIFSYTLGTNLYWRQQRDRYDNQYLIGPTTKLLRKAAPNTGNRLQFQLI
jgi:hypothetical protein